MPPPDDVEPGPFLERALRLRGRGRAQTDALRAVAVVATLVGATVLVIAAVAGFVFFIGTAGSWLHEHVTFFASHPRLAAGASWCIGAAIVVTSFLAGRASVRRPRGGS